MSETPGAPRRLVILTEGQFSVHDAKTAMGVIRYGRTTSWPSSTRPWPAGTCREFLPSKDVPFVATLDEALAQPVMPDGLLIGIAPTGGKLPRVLARDPARGHRGRAGHPLRAPPVRRRRPGVRGRGRRSGSRLIDYRRPPDRMETSVGRKHRPGSRVILTVGTDCAIGKMSVALELVAAARRAGDSAVMVPTGQTGMMIEGWGVAVDRVISDFTNGTVEWLVEQGEARADWVLVEGQGSIDHPAYSAVTHGPHPRRDAARDDPRPQARARRARLRRTCPRRRSRSPS